MKIVVLSLLILTSCSRTVKNCDLIGTWKSIEFYSDKAVDLNKDGVYNKELLKEDECTEVVFHFMSNGKAERFYKSKRTHCKFKKSTLNYVVKNNQIIFTVSGMKQTHKFNITNCKLHFYGVHGSGMTKNGKQSFLINSVFKKE